MSVFRWMTEGLCCTLCNPVRLTELATCGVVVGIAGRLELEICEGCLAVLGTFPSGETRQIPMHEAVQAALQDLEQPGAPAIVALTREARRAGGLN